MIRLTLIAAASALALAACQPAANDKAAPEAEAAPAAATTSGSGGQPGAMAPSFTLVDAEGVQRNLADFRGKTVVLEWTNEGCPYVKKHYTGAMQALQRQAVDEGVVWLTLISSAPGTQGFVEGQAARDWKTRTNGAATHLLLDPTGQVGRLYDAKTTPDMRVIDPQGRLVYVGGIDDRPPTRSRIWKGPTISSARRWTT